MRKFIITFLIFSALSIGIQAQSNFDKAAEEAANIICNCVNKTYKSIDELMTDETGEKAKQLDACMESSNEIMEKKFGNLEKEPGFSDSMMFELMLEKLAKNVKCDLASAIMQMAAGLEEFDEEDSGEE